MDNTKKMELRTKFLRTAKMMSYITEMVEEGEFRDNIIKAVSDKIYADVRKVIPSGINVYNDSTGEDRPVRIFRDGSPTQGERGCPMIYGSNKSVKEKLDKVKDDVRSSKKISRKAKSEAMKVVKDLEEGLK